MRLIEGKVAIVTGSGRGIGAATAKLLAQHGARLVIVNAEPTPYDELADEILREPIGTALPALLDRLR